MRAEIGIPIAFDGFAEQLDLSTWRLQGVLLRIIAKVFEENERLFGIKIDDLLTVDGQVVAPENVYRKVVPSAVAAALAKAAVARKEQETVGDLAA